MGFPASRPLGVVVGLVTLLLVGLASVAFGSRVIPFGDVIAAFVSFSETNDHLVVRELRVPRTLVGVGIGTALGVAGAVMQGVTRNALAGPGILGVNAGAAAGVVSAIFLFGVGTLRGYVWFAFGGAAVACVVVYLLGSIGRDGPTPVKLALAGAAFSALMGGVTSAIILADESTLDAFRFWVIGSLSGRDGGLVSPVLPFLTAGMVACFVLSPSLNALALGDEVAASLGVRVNLVRGLVAAGVVLLVGSAVAIAGPIGFVGLVIPHVARWLTGPDYRWILVYSAILAPIFLLGADLVGRFVVRPGELQVGIVTAAIGGPFFIALVRKHRLVEL